MIDGEIGISQCFGRVVQAYKAYRPAYPQALFDRLLKEIPKDRRTTIVDLGAGTGLSLKTLVPYFDTILAVEPDARMAETLSDISSKIVVYNKTAEDFDTTSESVDLVIAANSFHWMDGSIMCKAIARWLRQNGLFAAYGYGFPRAPEKLQAILTKELEGHWEEFRHPRLRESSYSYTTIRDSAAFRKVRKEVISNIVPMKVSEIIGFLKSTSWASSYMQTLSAEGESNYLIELERSIQSIIGESIAPIDLSLELVLAWK